MIGLLRTQRVLTVVLCTWLGFGSALGESPQAELGERFFESKVRPILVGICGDCHGKKKQEGGLRLDHEEGLLRGGSLGAAVRPGDVDESLLIRAVLRVDESLAMPPKKPLDQQQIEVLERWVKSGAKWPVSAGTNSPGIDADQDHSEHWAYQPVSKPMLPPVEATAWGKTSIDWFVLASLERNGLKPSEVAKRETLLRRAYYNLLGLPPSPAAVARFVEDTRPDAFARVVDELLSRPEYGERWGRHWLDVARYGDAKGYVDAGEVKYPFAYTYRDYVIRSFNRDLPYDQFLREQIAADRLPEATTESLAALGFLTVGSRFNFFPHEIIDDRIDVVTRGLLGQSVACARCHDHKYDPIPAADYYRLYSIFAASKEPTLDRVPVLASVRAKDDTVLGETLEKAAREYREHRRQLHEKVMFELRAWAGDYLRYVVQTTPEHRTEAQPEVLTKRGLIREVSAYASGGVWRWRAYLKSQPDDDPVFGLWTRLGRLSRDRFEVEAEQVLAMARSEGAINPLVIAEFKGQTPTSMADVADRYAVLLEGTDARWRELLKEDPTRVGFDDPKLEEIRLALYGDDAPGTLALEDAFDYCTLDESVELRKHFAAVEKVFLKEWDRAAPRPMMMEDRPQWKDQRVFLRGDSKRLGAVVSRSIPRSLGLTQDVPWGEGSGRLELARALASAENSLTARVIVNRVWAWHFGAGLQRRPSDFGTRSEGPSHPELLDYLARDFVEHGWSIKRLHRQIMLSATWQQSSVDRPGARDRDPDNRWLWRQNRRRMDFESMRDSMLLVSGELELRSEGPPVRISPGAETNRWRTLYTYVDREKLEDLFRVFDFPSPDLSAEKRASTTVPQQTLFLLNSSFVLHQARALVRRFASDLGAAPSNWDQKRLVDRLFQNVYLRQATVEEQRLAGRFLESRRDASSDGDGDGMGPWVELAQTLILSNEFLFVD